MRKKEYFINKGLYKQKVDKLLLTQEENLLTIR